MSQTPWMKWFPSDWRGDPKVRSCEPITRYVWMEMLGLMHDAEPYGHLVINGRAMDAKTLARVISVEVAVVKSALKELREAGVFSETDSGIVFSRRMVRDENRAKTLRENGKRGGNPSLKKQALTPPLDIQVVNPPVMAQNTEARSQKPEARKQAATDSTEAAERARKAVVDLKRAIMDAYRQAGSQKFPDTHRASIWIAKGYDPTICVAVIAGRLARNPNVGDLKYFDTPIHEEHERLAPAGAKASAAVKMIVINGRSVGEPLLLRALVDWRADPALWERHGFGPPPGHAACEVPAEYLNRQEHAA